MNSNENNILSAHNETHNLCNPHPSETYKYSYRDMLECWHSARENLVRWGVDDGTDKPGFSTWIKEFHGKKDNKLSEKLFYSHKSHQSFYDQCSNSDPVISQVILNNIDCPPSDQDEKLVKLFMTGSARVESYNTHSYAKISDLLKEFPEDDGESWLKRCENCDELAYDGRICHNCGAKDIGE